MSVAMQDGAIAVGGDCGVEEAETLLRLLLEHPLAPVDLAGAGRLHTALVQVLLATRRSVQGALPASFLGTWVLPQVLDGERESASKANGSPSQGADTISRSSVRPE